MKLKWNVILKDNGRIRAYNIFNNLYVNEGVDELFAKPELSREEIDEEMKRLTQWQFWSRCEYEFIIYGWPTNSRDKGYKIDVFEQLQMNWERFIDYVYDMYCFGGEEDE